MVVKKMESYVSGFFFCNTDHPPPPPTHTHTHSKIILPKTSKEKPESNEYNWNTEFEGINLTIQLRGCLDFCNELIKLSKPQAPPPSSSSTDQ